MPSCAYPESEEKLIKVNLSTSISVKLLKKCNDLIFLNENPVVIQPLHELLQVQRPAVVVIHNPKSSI